MWAFVMEAQNEVKPKSMGLLASLSPPNAHTRKRGGVRGWLISHARRTRTPDMGGSAWSVLVLVKRAHGINRISRLAVLVHARTFGLIQAAPYEKEQASFERLLDGSFKRAVGDQTSPAPERVRASLEGPFIAGARRWAKRTSRRAQGGRVRKSAVGPAWLPLHQEETQASFEGASKRAHVWTEPGCS